MTARGARDDRARAVAIATAAGWEAAWMRSTADVRATLHGCWFDLAAAERVREFFATFLRHTKGKWQGEPFVLLPWQWEGVIAPLFGWRRADGTRRFRRAYVSTAKKSGKSELASGIALYLLVAGDDKAPEIYLTARDRWQASICFENAARMVRQSPALRSRLEIVDSRKLITFAAQMGKLEALSADAPKSEGVSAVCVVYDELHVQDRGLFDALQYAGAARSQPLQIAITTAGVYDETTIGWQQYTYARGVLDGTIEDDGFFAAIWEAPRDADWSDPQVWALGNPSLGVTVQADELAEACQAAHASPSSESSFRRYRLNQWVQQRDRWLPLATWDLSAGHAIDAETPGGPAFGGCDLASVSDMSAAVWLRPCPHEAGAWDVVCRCWLPEATLRSSRNAPLYATWAQDGYLTVLPGAVQDHAFIIDTLTQDAARFGAASLALDRAFEGLTVGRGLADAGLAVYPVGMGFFSMGPLVAELERLVLSGKLHHGGHPILRWCVDGVEMKTDPAGNRKPARDAREKKIDALIACLLALDRALRHQAEPAPDPDYSPLSIWG